MKFENGGKQFQRISTGTSQRIKVERHRTSLDKGLSVIHRQTQRRNAEDS